MSQEIQDYIVVVKNTSRSNRKEKLTLLASKLRNLENVEYVSTENMCVKIRANDAGVANIVSFFGDQVGVEKPMRYTFPEKFGSLLK